MGLSYTWNDEWPTTENHLRIKNETRHQLIVLNGFLVSVSKQLTRHTISLIYKQNWHLFRPNLAPKHVLKSPERGKISRTLYNGTLFIYIDPYPVFCELIVVFDLYMKTFKSNGAYVINCAPSECFNSRVPKNFWAITCSVSNAESNQPMYVYSMMGIFAVIFVIHRVPCHYWLDCVASCGSADYFNFDWAHVSRGKLSHVEIYLIKYHEWIH